VGVADLTARDFDNEGIIRALRVSSDGALVTMSYMVQQTHSGRFFFASYYNASVASAGTLDMLAVTSADADLAPHIGMMTDAGAQGTFSVYEAVTASNNGTTVPIYNANRQSTKVPVTVAYHTPTISNTGTAIIPAHFQAGGSGGNAIGSTGGDLARIPELVLLPSTKYLFRFTNTSNGATPVSMQLGWFENV